MLGLNVFKPFHKPKGGKWIVLGLWQRRLHTQKNTSLLARKLLPQICKKKETKPEPEVNYTNFKILTVKIAAMPFVDASSTSWDILDGPDVFFNMEDVNNNVIYNGSSSRVNDILTTSIPITWSFVSAYQITNIGIAHYVTVYDYDTIDPNDLIGYVGFKMEDHKSGYPKTITKSNGALTITITGEWY